MIDRPTDLIRHRDAGKPVILLRTHYLDEAVLDLYHELETRSGLPVCLLADQTGTRWSYPEGVPAVSITLDGLAALGLPLTRRTLWRCGDYGLYAAAAALPDAPFFWIVEHDVRFRVPDLAGFFASPAWGEADLLASHLRPARGRWPWYHSMAGVVDQVWRCLFPVVRVSRRATALLLAERQRLGGLFATDPDRFGGEWPNDEAFVASTLAAHGCALVDMRVAAPGSYTDAFFLFHGGFHPAELPLMPPDCGLVHPVLRGGALLRKLWKVRRRVPRPDLERKAALLREDGIPDTEIEALLRTDA